MHEDTKPKYGPPAPETAASFREFHNEMRKYRRRVFVPKTADPDKPFKRQKTDLEIIFGGKKGRRLLKRIKNLKRQEAGHMKGDNRTSAEATAAHQMVDQMLNTSVK